MLLLHVSTLLCNRQEARSKYHAKLYVNAVFVIIRFHGNPPCERQFVHGVEGRTEERTERRTKKKVEVEK